MTLDEIKSAIDSGKRVYQHHKGYEVIKDNLGQYLITYKYNDFCIGLTWRDGVTMNGKEEEFFVGDSYELN